MDAEKTDWNGWNSDQDAKKTDRKVTCPKIYI